MVILIGERDCQRATFFVKLRKVMRKLKIIGISFLLSALAIAITFFVIGYLKPEKAGLVIDSEPKTLVYINGQEVGRSRYETTINPGDVVIRLVPQDTSLSLTTFETKVSLVSGIKTIIKREFGPTEELSGGIIVSFEKTVEDEAGLAIVTIPDAAQITIDGQIRGISPYKNPSLTEGEHNLVISISGYEPRTEAIRTYKGYKLTAIVKLKKSEQVLETPQPNPSPVVEKVKVKILTTPTGFLRVRNEPTNSSFEVGQVESGEIYEVLEEDLEAGWVKIELSGGSEGWISNEYTQKIQKATSSFTPSPSPED